MRPSAATARWMLSAGTTTFEAKSGYGLDRDTELAQLRAIRAAGGIPTWLGAHAVPPEYPDADALPRLRARRGPPRSSADRRGSGRLPRARRVRRRAGPALSRRRSDAGLALRLHGDQFTEQGAIPLAIELGARSVDHLEATGADGVAELASSDVTGCCSRRARSSSTARCRLPVRSSTPGASVALATDFNPGSAFTESLPLVCSLAATQLHLSPAEALTAATVNAAHVLGRADRKGRIAPGLRRRPVAPRRARLALPRLPPRPRPRRRGRARRRESGARLGVVPTRKQRRRQQKERRHEYEYVYVDDEGNEVEAEAEPERTQRRQAEVAGRQADREAAGHARSSPAAAARRRACAAQDRPALLGARRPPRGDLRADHGDRRLLPEPQRGQPGSARP